jgi:hypothetical protein
MAPRKGACHVPVSSQAFIPRPATASSLAPVVIEQSGSEADSSRKLSDLLNGRKGSELMSEWENMSRTPTTTDESATQGRESQNVPETERPEVLSGGLFDPRDTSARQAAL